MLSLSPPTCGGWPHQAYRIPSNKRPAATTPIATFFTFISSNIYSTPVGGCSKAAVKGNSLALLAAKTDSPQGRRRQTAASLCLFQGRQVCHFADVHRRQIPPRVGVDEGTDETHRTVPEQNIAAARSGMLRVHLVREPDGIG